MRLNRLDANKISEEPAAAPSEAALEVHVPQPWIAVVDFDAKRLLLDSAHERGKMRWWRHVVLQCPGINNARGDD
jgi:hypothetical protein